MADIVFIKIIKNKISKKELKSFLGKPFDDMIKFVIDAGKEIVALGGEMHADAEEVLLEAGSKQKDLWGGNIYPDAPEGVKIEWSSFINIRPSQNNRSMEIQDENLKEKLNVIVNKLFLN